MQSFRLAGGHHSLDSLPIWLSGAAQAAALSSAAKSANPTIESLIAHATSRFLLAEVCASGIQVARTHTSIGRNPHDQILCSVIASGHVTLNDAECDVRLGPGDVVIIDMLQPFAAAIEEPGGQARVFSLWMPRDVLGKFAIDEVAAHLLVLAASTPAASLIGHCLMWFSAHSDRISAREVDRLADGLILLIGQALTLAPNGRRPKAAVSATRSFLAVRSFITKHLASPELNVSMIAGTFGMSRASLYRMFEPVGGVAAFIRRQRLQRAFQDITANEFRQHKIGSIAYRSGFNNANSFSVAFKQAFGMTPAAARRSAGGRRPVG